MDRKLKSPGRRKNKVEKRAMKFRSLVFVVVFLSLAGSLEAQTWHSWEPLASGLQGSPSAVSWGPNRLDIFALDPNNRAWHTWWDGKAWGLGESLAPPFGGQLSGSPVAISWGPKRLDIFAPTYPDQKVWHLSYDGSWGSGESLGSMFAGGFQGVVSWAPNRFDIFAVGIPAGGSYNKLWHGWSDGRTWGPGEWFDIAKGALDSQASAVSWGPNRLDIFAMSGDRRSRLWHQWFDGRAWGENGCSRHRLSG